MYPFLSSICPFLRSRDHKYNHVRIHTKSEGGKTKYYLTDHTLFDSIYELVEHYRQAPLRSPQFEQILHTPVPRKVGGVYYIDHTPLLCISNVTFTLVCSVQYSILPICFTVVVWD